LGLAHDRALFSRRELLKISRVVIASLPVFERFVKVVSVHFCPLSRVDQVSIARLVTDKIVNLSSSDTKKKAK
jgi:hypothetical protein